MEYTVNNTTLKYEAAGTRTWGKDVTLLEKATDLTRHTPWREKGFGIETLFEEGIYHTFRKNTRALLMKCWHDAGMVFGADFPLDQYHSLAGDFDVHLRAIERTRLLHVDEFPVPVSLVEARISEICNVPLVAQNPFDSQKIFHFRVIRPNQSDNNPLHRDVWLEDYDDCINLYIPVAGSNEKSSLILFPGSHYWPESRIEKTDAGALINGVKFNVPAVTAIAGDYSVERPSPGENQVLVFSPYLIHGGAVNLNPGMTRISIEMRLWKRQDPNRIL